MQCTYDSTYSVINIRQYGTNCAEGKLQQRTTFNTKLTREAIIPFKMPIDEMDGKRLSMIANHLLEIAATWRDFLLTSNESGKTENEISPAIHSDVIRA